jgi:hypothetical protein
MEEMMKGTENPHQEENEGLNHPSSRETKIQGKFKQKVKNMSLYTTFTTQHWFRTLSHVVARR